MPHRFICGVTLMCGITGWLYRPGQEPSREVLGRLAYAIRHRGPDDEGFFHEPAAGLAVAHRRLSIIDLTAGSHQPKMDATTGVVLAYSGELYNFQALRRELQALGHAFKSAGDTAVLLRSYLEWGMDCLPRSAGMFAVALWDPSDATLHLARDAMGMKPLYFVPSTTAWRLRPRSRHSSSCQASSADQIRLGCNGFLILVTCLIRSEQVCKGCKSLRRVSGWRCAVAGSGNVLRGSRRPNWTLLTRGAKRTAWLS